MLYGSIQKANFRERVGKLWFSSHKNVMFMVWNCWTLFNASQSRYFSSLPKNGEIRTTKNNYCYNRFCYKSLDINLMAVFCRVVWCCTVCECVYRSIRNRQCQCKEYYMYIIFISLISGCWRHDKFTSRCMMCDAVMVNSMAKHFTKRIIVRKPSFVSKEIGNVIITGH